MKYFHRIATGVDVMPLAHQLVKSSLWDSNTVRTHHPDSPHGQVSDILLRFQEVTDTIQAVMDEHESVFYPAWAELSAARPLIFDLMRRVEASRLGRVLVTKLAPGKTIAPHVDGGAHAAYYDRYHIVLQGLPGSLFRCGDEQVCMQTGEVWWFDNSVEHQVVNNSADDRIHMVVDLKC